MLILLSLNYNYLQRLLSYIFRKSLYLLRLVTYIFRNILKKCKTITRTMMIITLLEEDNSCLVVHYE